MDMLRSAVAAGLVMLASSAAHATCAPATLRSLEQGTGIIVVGRCDGTVQHTTADGGWVQASTGVSVSINAITYTRGAFWGVGDNGTIINSPAGDQWSTVRNPATSHLLGFAASPTRYVAVGVSDIIVSADGAAWTSAPLPSLGAEYHIIDIEWLGTRFAATTNNGYSLTSTDGETWQAHAMGIDFPSEGVFASAANGAAMVVVGRPHLILNSPDGINWTRVTAPGPDWSVYTPGQLKDVRYNGSEFVAAGFFYDTNAYVGTYLYSADGVNWTWPDIYLPDVPIWRALADVDDTETTLTTTAITGDGTLYDNTLSLSQPAPTPEPGPTQEPGPAPETTDSDSGGGAPGLLMLAGLLLIATRQLSRR